MKYIEKDLPSYRLIFPPEMEAKTDVPKRFEDSDYPPEEWLSLSPIHRYLNYYLKQHTSFYR